MYMMLSCLKVHDQEELALLVSSCVLNSGGAIPLCPKTMLRTSGQIGSQSVQVGILLPNVV
jgi:hypothetical protein